MGPTVIIFQSPENIVDIEVLVPIFIMALFM